MRKSRLVVVAGTITAGLGLAFAVVAYACTWQGAMTLNKQAAPVGGAVTGTGSFYNPGIGDEVQLHFNDLNGPMLWHGLPGPQGAVAFSFIVPQAAPGYYVIVAVQQPTAASSAVYSPMYARASLQVLARPAPQPGSSVTSGPGTSTTITPTTTTQVVTVTVPRLVPGPVVAPAAAPAGSTQAVQTQTVNRPGAPTVGGASSQAAQSINGAALGVSADVPPALAPVPWARVASNITAPSSAAGARTDVSSWVALGTLGTGLLVIISAVSLLVAQRVRTRVPVKLDW